MAAVSNFGNDASWVGHPMSAVNAYGFGRLAWSPAAFASLDDSATIITEEWIKATWGSNPIVVQALSAMLMPSWEVGVTSTEVTLRARTKPPRNWVLLCPPAAVTCLYCVPWQILTPAAILATHGAGPGL